MASVALRHSRTLLPAFRLPWLRQRYAAAILPTFLAQAPFNWAIPSLQSLLELFPPFLLAVPKKKVSHSRKSMRSANKGLKDKKNIVNCQACGQPKLAHHLCDSCFSLLTRRWKQQGWGGDVDKLPEIQEMDSLSQPEPLRALPKPFVVSKPKPKPTKPVLTIGAPAPEQS